MATKPADLDNHISRKLRLQDIRVLFKVVEYGSMARAATQLHVSQPAVSQVIADLEHTLGVKLFDRSSRGVSPTLYGHALLRAGKAAFQDLKEGIEEIGFLADPTAGELRIGCNVAITHSILPAIIERFSRRHPKVILQVSEMATPTDEYPQLREHRIDLMLIRLSSLRREDDLAYEIESADDDRLIAAAGITNPWARRRKIDLADLFGEPWTVTPQETLGYAAVAAAFAARGLPMPQVTVPSFSIPLRASLAATGRFIAVLHASVMRYEAKRYELKPLPIELPQQHWPIAIVTLKNRTLSPLAQRFTACVRDVAKSFARQTRPSVS